jgi:small GTP-binding protein
MLKSKKVVLVGHFGVGKTSLIRQFVHNTFSESYKVSIGVHISKKEVVLENKGKMSLIIWDIEGTKEITNIRSSYLLGTHGILYVFDVNRPSTYENLGKDLDKLREVLPTIPLLVIGNKIDILDDENIKDKFQKKKFRNDFLTSAKHGANVTEAFNCLAKELL